MNCSMHWCDGPTKASSPGCENMSLGWALGCTSMFVCALYVYGWLCENISLSQPNCVFNKDAQVWMGVHFEGRSGCKSTEALWRGWMGALQGLVTTRCAASGDGRVVNKNPSATSTITE